MQYISPEAQLHVQRRSVAESAGTATCLYAHKSSNLAYAFFPKPGEPP